MTRRGARCAWALGAMVMAGCTCGEPARPPRETAPAPVAASSGTDPAPPPSAPTAATEPARPTLARARSFRARLAEARRLAQADRDAEAYALFAALVRERPADRRLRCEAGYVAFRAGQLDDAEREITAAIESWPSPPMRRDRAPLAMCLYNRGLVAEARGDHESAARAWRRSIELRPNATVERRLAAFDVPPAPDESDDEEDGEAQTIEERLREIAFGYGAESSDASVYRSVSPASGRTVASVELLLPLDDDEGPEETVKFVLLADGRNVVDLEPTVDEVRYHSWYDDRAFIAESEFLSGPPELGEIVAIKTVRYGRGDGDGIEDQLFGEDEIYLCAERFDWRCVSFPLLSHETVDCESLLRCVHVPGEQNEDEAAEDQAGSAEDDEYDDDREPFEYYSRGFDLVWRLDGGAIVLTRNPAAELTEWRGEHEEGRIELVPRFRALR